jgi:hypothetical protein
LLQGTRPPGAEEVVGSDEDVCLPTICVDADRQDTFINERSIDGSIPYDWARQEGTSFASLVGVGRVTALVSRP